MKSLKTFLIAVLLAMTTLVNFVAAVHGYRKSILETERLLDAQLLQQIQVLNVYAYHNYFSSPAAAVPDFLNIPVPQSIHQGIHNGSTAVLVFQAWNSNAELVMKSSNAPAEPVHTFEEGFQDINFSGYRWRSLAHLNEEQDLWLFVAERADARYQLGERIGAASVLPIVLGIPVIGLLIWLIVSAGLRPVSRLADKLRSKQARDLTPITLTDVPNELKLLAASTNELLRRLDASFEREKRFTADAAHELRTPIAALKIHLQNLIDEIDIPPPESVFKLKQGIDRMNHLVEQILTLNRTAPDHYMAQFSCIDLFSVVKHGIETETIDIISEKNQHIEFEGVPCEVYGDLFALETLVHNLLGNAAKYTPPGGQIVVKTFTRNGAVVLQVMDSGPGIPESMRERVFERFHRLGGDRHSSNVIGCGLGLSIVKHIVDLHGASIELGDSRFESGLSVTVTFPTDRRCLHGKRTETHHAKV